MQKVQNIFNHVLSAVSLGAGILGIYTANSSLTPNQLGTLAIATFGCFFSSAYLFFYQDKVAEDAIRAKAAKEAADKKAAEQ